MSKYSDLNEQQQFACRVIADHARSAAFAITDGILPGNEGRNYVLRKIMRRAIYHGREHLGLSAPFFYKVCDLVVEQMRAAFPELETQRDFISKMVRLEEERFITTMTVGLGKLNELDVVPDTEADPALFKKIAKLYDTYGTPRDLIRVYLQEKGISFDEDDYNHRFETALQELQNRSGIGQTHRKSEVNPVYAQLLGSISPSEFLGYETTQIADATITAILKNDQQVEKLESGEQGTIVLDRTPFYAESGGQVGDSGILVKTSFGKTAGSIGNGNDDFVKMGGVAAKATVSDTFSPISGLVLHKVSVLGGSLSVGDQVTATVHEEKRNATRRNHTATHLVHAALKEVLGSHVKQAGSVVAPNYLRFDFTHYQPMSEREITEIEDLVNQYILKNEPVTTNLMSIEDAMRTGAVAMFGEKYGSEVRVLSVGNGDFSMELCGGTHVRATGDIGSFKIITDEAIASGVRRIRAITGLDAFKRFRESELLIHRSLDVLKAQRDYLPTAVEKLQDEVRRAKKEIEELKLKIATAAAGDASSNEEEFHTISGIKVLGKIVDGLDANGQRQLSDTLLARLGSGVVILGRKDEEKASLIVRVSADLTGRVKAGDIIKGIVPIVGGRGGGRPDMAEGGGNEPEKLNDALKEAFKLIETFMVE